MPSLGSDEDHHLTASGNDKVLWVRYAHENVSYPRESRPAYYRLDSAIGNTSRFNPVSYRGVSSPFIKLSTSQELGSQQTPWFYVPVEVNDFNSMMNDCIHGIQLRVESEATQEGVTTRVGTEGTSETTGTG